MMKKYLLISLICAAMCPVISAQQLFHQKVSTIDRSLRGKTAESFNAWMELNRAKDLSVSQRNTVLVRAIQTIFQIKDAAVQQKGYAQLLAAVKAQNQPYVSANFVIQAYRVKNDPHRADVLEFIKEVGANGTANDISGLINALSNSKDYYDQAEELYKKSPQPNILCRLAVGAVKHKNDQAKADQYFKELVTALQKAEKKESLINPLYRALPELLSLDYQYAMKVFTQFKPLLSQEQSLLFEFGTAAVNARRNGDLASFKAAVKKVLALPYGKTRSQLTNVLASGADPETATLLYQAELKNPALTPQERYQLFAALRSRCGDVKWFQRYFVDATAYGRWRKYTDEMIRIADSVTDRKLTNFNFFRDNANTAFGYGDFAFAVQQIAEAEKVAQDNQIKSLLDIAVMIRLWQKDAKAVTALIARNNVKEDALYWRVVDFFSKGGKMAKFNDDELNSEAKLRVLRRASELFYRAKRYDVCRDIYNDILQNQFISLEPKKYEATYLEDPPRTADGFMRTKYSQRWRNMETRFVPYGENPNINTDIDVKRFLKDTEKPQVDPEWKTGIFCAYDIHGLHIYIRGVDPGIAEVMQGKRDAGVLEFTFRPNADAPYHMIFFEELPYAVDNINLEYASPSPRYRNTQDTFITDSAPAKDGFAAHVYIPWITFYDSLPLNGKCWYLGLQRWCKGGGQTISGQAHELARMLNIQFDFNKKQVRAIKRNLCLTAFNRFRNSKTLPVWKTDHKLGDPEFYEKELASLVAELEKAGKLLEDEDADIDAIFTKYMAAWAEFEHTIAEKRRLYLKKKIFE